MFEKVWVVCGQPNIAKAKTGAPITSDIIPSISFALANSLIVSIALGCLYSLIVSIALVCSFSLSST
jgi:hypothetical protein